MKMHDFLQNAVITMNPFAAIAIVMCSSVIGFLIGKFYG